jgi:hypothetical protein
MLFIITFLVTCLSLLLSSVTAHSAVFDISSGDVSGLVSAITTANSNGDDNTINLAPGTYSLNSIDNNTNGPNGLPSITSRLTIQGIGVRATVIERAAGAAAFRILHVAAAGTLTLSGLTVRNGLASDFAGDRGGGILAIGTVTIINSAISENIARSRESFGVGGGIDTHRTLTVLNSVISHNTAGFVGGGIAAQGAVIINNSTIADNIAEEEAGIAIGGTVTVINSTISRNHATLNTGGGLGGVGTVTINRSTISENSADVRGGGINLDNGTLTIANSTIGGNLARHFGGGIFVEQGVMTVTNSTIAGNSAVFSGQGGGIFNFGGTSSLQNTILARNDASEGPDCFLSVDSLGHNLIGSPTDCAITLQPSDLTDDPGLGSFLDSGASGNGRFPLLDTSPAIDKGDNQVCSSDPVLAGDQLGKPRSAAGTVDGVRTCDIGAEEFFPLVNDLMQLRQSELVTSFDPAPVPGAPAGTFLITTKFDNISNETIFFLSSEVVSLQVEREGAAPEDQPLLLNADGGPGRVGARMTPDGSLTTSFGPGATGTFVFRIGLQTQEPFTFWVNMLGERRTSNPAVSMAENP